LRAHTPLEVLKFKLKKYYCGFRYASSGSELEDTGNFKVEVGSAA
jgi:hypothetical protein